MVAREGRSSFFKSPEVSGVVKCLEGSCKVLMWSANDVYRYMMLRMKNPPGLKSSVLEMSILEQESNWSTMAIFPDESVERS